MTTLLAYVAPYSKAIAAFLVTLVVALLLAAEGGVAWDEFGAAVASAAATGLGVAVAPKNRPRRRPARCTCPLGSGWTPGYSATCPVHGTSTGGGARATRLRRRLGRR